MQAVVTVALLGWLASRIDSDVFGALAGVSPVVFALCVALFATSQFWGAWRLAIFLRSGVPLAVATRLTLQGYFLSNFLPGTIGGDVYRGVALARRGVAMPLVVSSLLADRAVNLAAAFGVLVATLPFSRLAADATARQQTLAIAAGCALATAALVLAWRTPTTAVRQPWRALATVGAELRLLAARPQALAAGLALSVASLGAALAAQWLLARHIGLDLGFANVAAVLLVVFFVTLLPISINGLGVQEAGIVYFLGVMGASPEQAVALALLSRALILTVSLLGGLAMLGARSAPDASADRSHGG